MDACGDDVYSCFTMLKLIYFQVYDDFDEGPAAPEVCFVSSFFPNKDLNQSVLFFGGEAIHTHKSAYLNAGLMKHWLIIMYCFAQFDRVILYLSCVCLCFLETGGEVPRTQKLSPPPPPPTGRGALGYQSFILCKPVVCQNWIFLSFFLRSSIGGVVYVTVFKSSTTWAATFRLRG